MTNTMIARAAGDYVLNMTEQEITLIKNTACKGGTDEQLAHLIYMAKSTSLDPLKGQIRSIPRGAQRSVQIGIDGFRLIAERTGRYAPGKEATYEYDEDGLHDTTPVIGVPDDLDMELDRTLLTKSHK